METTEKLLTKEEVAETLRLSTATIQSMIDTAELPAIKIRTSWRIRATALEDFLKSRENTKATA